MLSIQSCPCDARIVISFIAILLFGHQAIAADSANEGEFVPLFDGKTLQGWTTADGKPVTRGWQAEDGLLVRTGSGGSIYTEKDYGNFELRFEWRISRRGNSGIKYRIAHYDKGTFGRPGWLGYEYQIWDDANRNSSADTSAAAIYMLQAPKKDKKLKPTDEFNTGRIVAVGSHLEHWLNGEKVLDVDTDTPEWAQQIKKTKFGPVKNIFQNPKGRIQLQDHGNKVWFRNIEIREIESE